jgi:hypothetical protein
LGVSVRCGRRFALLHRWDYALFNIGARATRDGLIEVGRPKMIEVKAWKIHLELGDTIIF